ncbi:MAG TPA: type VI secretion system tube protein Hcp [Thermoanaerobaculia bacterium]|nr:type VI secretion system tube protein Hcp [Thermoanaerobaculia bacterium]
MASNMYLKFEEPAIEAGSTAAEHKAEIEILSWNHGFTQPTSPTRSTAGSGTVEQATHHNMSFTKYLDAATHSLLKYCWSGKQIGKATLTCYRSSGAEDNKPVEYLKVVMEHVIISNYSVSGGPGDIPVENVSLDYGIVQYNYADQKESDGTGEGAKPAKHNLETRTIS